MKKFEYMDFVLGIDAKDNKERLNQFGEQGWEAYAVLNGGMYVFGIVYFKRKTID